MNLLCWDTCTEEVSVTLCLNSKPVISRTCSRYEKGGAAGCLIPLIQEICQEADFPLSRLHALGVTRGPGSLTGIRLGLSAAYGLQAALSIPLLGETLFDLLATEGRHLFPGHPLWVFVDTYGASWAVQPYDVSGKPLCLPFLLTLKELENQLKKSHNSIENTILLGWRLKISSKVFEDTDKKQLNISQLLAQSILHDDLFLRKDAKVKPLYLHPSVPLSHSKSSIPFS